MSHRQISSSLAPPAVPTDLASPSRGLAWPTRFEWFSLTLAVAILYAWRPFFLGFYHDDWDVLASRMSWDRLLFYTREFANRPVLGLLHVVFTWVSGATAAGYHALIALLALLTAGCVLTYLKTHLSRIDGAWWPAGLLATLIWLAMPWSFASTAWPIMGPTLVAVVGVALGGAVLVVALERGGLRLHILAAMLFLMSYLCYESFYLAYPLFVALAATVTARSQRPWKRNALIALLMGTIALLLAIGYSRSTSLWEPQAPTKSFNPQWWHLLIGASRALPHTLTAAMSPYKKLSRWLLIALAAFAGAFIIVDLRKRAAGWRRTCRLLLVMGLGAAGVYTAIVPLALAHYAPSPAGLFSRVNLGLSFWIAVLLGGLLAVGGPIARPARRVSLLLALVITGTMVAVVFHRALIWHSVWQQERALLDQAPVAGLESLPAGAAVLLDQPVAKAGVYGFDASWDLNYAIRTRTHLSRGVWIYVHPQGFNVRFDGAKLVFFRGQTHWGVPIKHHLWVWRRDSGKLHHAASGLVIREEH